MSVVLGAIDNSAAGRGVLAATVAVSRVLGGEPVALHVREDGMANARAAAAAAGVEFEVGSGPVVAGLTAAAARRDVVALVVGARGTPGGRRPVGHTALELLTASDLPVVVVPPVAPTHDHIARILVALDGMPESAAALRATLERADRQGIDVVLLHVHGNDDVPAFEEQPHHEHEVWSREFIDRWHPGASGQAHLELRAGPPERHILAAARESKVDLIALAWARSLAPGHAAVVREALSSSAVPVLLVPVSAAPPALAGGGSA